MKTATAALLALVAAACSSAPVDVAAPHLPARVSAAAASTPEARARALHESAIVVDGHNDITGAILDRGFDLARPDGTTHTDLPRMKAGGITAEFFSIYVDRKLTGGAARRALDLIDATYQQVERHSDSLLLATSVADIRRAKQARKIAILMGIEGGHAIESSLFTLRAMYRLGVRYMTLTHTNSNAWADSAGGAQPEPAPHHGLSEFGREVVREMQRLGMLVDVSHVSDETFQAVMEVTKTPVIASHSSARALAPHKRNLSDAMLRDMTRNGGVVMVNFYRAFIDARCIGRSVDSCPPTPLSVLIDHIDHVVKVAGIDHVGLGSDFDGGTVMPAGMEGMDKLPRITLELVKRGYSDGDIRKILGENFLRVLGAAEEHARSTGTTLSGGGSQRTLDAGP